MFSAIRNWWRDLPGIFKACVAINAIAILISLVGGPEIALSAVISLVLLHLLLLLCSLSWCKHQWFVRLVCWFETDAYPVQLMDFEGGVVNTIAWGEWGRVLRSYTYYFHSIGPITLLPNGLVKESYHYFWRPLDSQLEIEMRLNWDTIVDWNRARLMDLNERRNLLSTVEKRR